MVNFKDKSMPAVIDKALDFINGMNTSVSSPLPMDESTAKGILKYLKELGFPASATDITARGEQEGWNPGFTQKLAGWAEKFESGERVLIKDPEYFSMYMREQLQELVEVERA
ncbi:DUF1889 family protein [Citrobacter amalonaticus]|jgi:hypothetical protein|uniref:DUF1889 family protein n=1 Tax=Citrobacter amalonaticus TaxID=35703 RepID=UPI00255AE6E6|nr:DUF1889 family protein [Citrobacter amalonaticus]MDL4616856.1 DUF1889 family protein [Citrobacter amalonaticus]MDL4620954.1 DUF1889 family protein [Citrobacter amalonaticus]